MERQETNEEVNVTEEKVNNWKEKIIKYKKYIIGGVVVIAAVIAILLFVTKPTIDLNEYMTINVEGYNTIGTAKVSFDEERFERDYKQKLFKAFKKNLGKSSGGYGDSEYGYLSDALYREEIVEEFLSDCVGGKLSKNSELCNGDTIKYVWECDDKESESIYGYKLKYSDIEIKVKNLKEVDTFNPFDEIEVVFEGINKEGTARIENEPNTKVAELEYRLDKASSLSNDDIVTVSISVDSDSVADYCAEKYGIIPSPMSKEYKVEGLGNYINTAKEISDESLAAMKAKGEEIYKEDIAKDWEDDTKLKSITYVGNYFLKKNESFGSDNILYLVYKIKINHKYENDGQKFNKTNDIYWYMSFSNISVNDKGENNVNLENYITPSSWNGCVTIDSGIKKGWFSTKTWSHAGYETVNDLHDDIIADNYTCEDNITK